MKKRVLGKTYLNISEVGCGGIPVQRITQEEANRMVDSLIENGINFIDSARGYTVSEEMIGKALVGRREKFVLATKSMARDYESMKNDIITSLKNFQTDYIDLYQMHNLKIFEGSDGALIALKEAKEKGIIKHIGVTSHSFDFLNKLLDMNDIPFETIQFPYNFLEPKGEILFEKANKKNIGVIVMKPLAGGNIDKPVISLKYILMNKNVSVAIPGMESVKQVIENSSVKDYSLNENEMSYIEETKNTIGKNFCHRCGYCLPCTKGIDIPSCFMFENYYKRYNLKDWAISRYNSMKVLASACIECHKCEKKCPYDLEIVKKLKQVKELFEDKNERK